MRDLHKRASPRIRVMASILRKGWWRGEESAPEGYTGFYFGEVMYRVIVDAPERVEDERGVCVCGFRIETSVVASTMRVEVVRIRRRTNAHRHTHRTVVSAAATSIATASRRCRNLSQHQQQYVHLRLSYYGAAHPATAATDIFFSPHACHTPCFALLRKKLRWSANYICQPTPTFRS